MEIYKITNKITNDFYVGSAINFKNRKWSHTCSLKKNNHKNQFIQNSWNKYGEKAFVFEVLEVVDKKENLIIREQHWIDILSPTFNLCKIAGNPLGVKHTDKSRKNMSLAHKNQSFEERGHKENCKCCICNRKIGIESPRYIPREERICVCGCEKSFICMITSSKRFISGHNKPQLGRKKSISTIEKQRNSLNKYFENGGKRPRLGVKLPEEQINKMRKDRLIPILQYNLNNNFIKEWDGASVVKKELNINAGNINNCLKGRKKTAGNFIWKYKFNN
jgi:group I intron endonuclease